MLTKWRKLTLRHSSPVTLWFGMLLACFAWLMHATMLLTPLWDDNAHLGHGVCIKLAPIVAAAKQYEQIHHDITHTEHNLPDDSAAYHLHHHTAPESIVPTSTVTQTMTVDAKASSEAMHSNHNVESSDPDTIKHASCDICLSMSAVIVPEVFAHTEPDSIELFGLFVTFLHHSNIDYPNNFLRPLVRAPPQAIIT